MNLYRKIDVESGLFIEDVILKEQPIDKGEYISTPVPGGFYLPKWNGTEWVEGGTKPDKQPQEPTLEERLEFIKTQNELALAELAEVILGGAL